jgi:hypothetical protein
MSDDDVNGSGPEDPFTIEAIVAQVPERQPWYKRGRVLVSAAVGAVVVASVLVDLPSHTTTAADTADQASILKQINADVGPCSYGVKETFLIFQDLKNGSLTPSELGQAPSLMRDDQTACSFASSTIFDLSNVEGTGTPAGKDIGDVVSVTTLWATSDALGAIEDIQSLSTDPGSVSTLADLSKQEAALARDRAQADADVAAADRVLGAHLPMPDLPSLPRLPGTS